MGSRRDRQASSQMSIYMYTSTLLGKCFFFILLCLSWNHVPNSKCPLLKSSLKPSLKMPAALYCGCNICDCLICYCSCHDYRNPLTFSLVLKYHYVFLLSSSVTEKLPNRSGTVPLTIQEHQEHHLLLDGLQHSPGVCALEQVWLASIFSPVNVPLIMLCTCVGHN